ncbi:MAG: prepilin-type N-terminal cleavage/methylation domain-containing protein [Fimbriimonadaceae bacterium]
MMKGRIRKGGFTFVEVSVVVFVITLMAALATPWLRAVQRSQEALGFRLSLDTIAQEARRLSLEGQNNMLINISDDGQIQLQATVDPANVPFGQTTQDQEGPVTSTSDNVRPGDAHQHPHARGHFLVDFQVADERITQQDWEAGFYPDGTADRSASNLNKTAHPTSGLLILRKAHHA